MTDVPATAAIPAAVPVTACTVATVAELPAVRVLLRSFLDHHPGARFHVLLVDSDDATGIAVPDGDVEFLHPSGIGVDAGELARLRTAWTARDLAAVLRPTLMRHLLRSATTSGPVLHLDPSVLVLGPIAETVLRGLVERSVVLLPRVLRPLPDDGLRPDAADLHAAGMFDPAMIAVNRGADGFLRSWAEHAGRTTESGGGPFLDAAVLVEHHVLRDPGIGLSVWNAGQRALRADERGVVSIDGVPLRTMHFAGFDPQRPWLLSAEVADRPRVLLSEHRLLARLCAGYVGALAAGAVDHGGPVALEQRVGAAPLPDTLRAWYRADWLAADRAGELPPAPWQDDAAEFLEWAFAPAGDRGGTRWASALWHDEDDLRRRFPDPHGADAAAFREWCVGVGVPSGVLPIDAVPAPATVEAPLTDQLGVSVLGTGPVADLLRAAATASGLPVSDRPDYPIVVACAGTGQLAERRHLIAVPATATDLPPRTDEVWVLSAVARDELVTAAGVPVHAITLPVPDTGERDEAAKETARLELGWPGKPDAVVFAGLADHGHERIDNALGVVAAFVAAFPPTAEDSPDRLDVRLVLLVTGAGRHPEAAERLRLATAADERIRLIEDPEPAERAQWLDAADCLVSLPRAEPAGSDRILLAVAEAAGRGIPVVGAEHGAAGELLAAQRALLVPDEPGGAQPNAVAAVEVLRAVADDPEAAARIGRTARAELLRTHGVAVAGERLRERVERAYSGWRARRFTDRTELRDDPLRPLRSARHVLLREPDVGGGHKIPMAPALRKAVLRVLNHYDAHLRTTLGTLADGMERTAEELLRRQDALRFTGGGEDTGPIVERLDRLTDQVTALDDRTAGAEDGMLRARADVAAHARRTEELEDAVVAESAKRGKQLEALADRLDRLTHALDRTLDRIDGLEDRTERALRERDDRTDAGVRAAGQALHASDALRRVVVREHERLAEEPGSPLAPPADVPSSLVLCDAGLMRLPADDGVMLPLLSSNGVWEPDLSALIDSLVEPDGVFLDIGAYVGYHTVRVLSRLGTSGKVVAVEPFEPAVKLLRHNVSMNVAPAAAERLTVLPAAAWDTAGTLVADAAMTGGVTVSPPPSDPAVSGDPVASPAASAPSAEDDQGHITPKPTVPAVRLDKEFERIPGLDGMRLSLVRVDAPGRGHRALGGLVRLLRRDRPHVFCAFSATRTSEVGDDPATVLREFGTWGFDLLTLAGPDPLTPQQVLDQAKDQHSVTLWLRPRGRAS